MVQEPEVAVSLDALAAMRLRGRREVLRCLVDRRLTATEVAEELKIAKSSAHFHLQALAEVALVERERKDRLWVQYGLTPVGRYLALHDRPRVTLLLGAAFALATAASAAFAYWLLGGQRGSSNPYLSERVTEHARDFLAPAFLGGCLLAAAAIGFLCWALLRARRSHRVASARPTTR